MSSSIKSLFLEKLKRFVSSEIYFPHIAPDPFRIVIKGVYHNKYDTCVSYYIIPIGILKFSLSNTPNFSAVQRTAPFSFQHGSFLTCSLHIGISLRVILLYPKDELLSIFLIVVSSSKDNLSFSCKNFCLQKNAPWHRVLN